MIGPGEGAIAKKALERAIAGVLAIVSSELVAAREFPSATWPVAAVRLLARVGTHVGLQVRALRVFLRTTGMGAVVNRDLLRRPARRRLTSSSTRLRRLRPARLRAARLASTTGDTVL